MAAAAPGLVRVKSTSFEDRVPTDREWYADTAPHWTQGMETVRSTAWLLESCMRSLVAVGPAFYEACASADVSGLVLTLIALHRLLVDYVDDLARRLAVAGGDEWSSAAAGTAFAPSPRTRLAFAAKGREPTATAAAVLAVVDAFRERESLVELADCLVETAKLVEVDSAVERALPGPIGGVMMFLEYVSRALVVADDALNELRGSHSRTAGAGAVATLALVGRAPRVAAFVAIGAWSLRAARAARLARTFRAVDEALSTSVRIWSVVAVALDNGLRHPRHGRSYCSLLKPPTARGTLTELALKAAPVPPTLNFWYRLGAPWQLRALERSAITWFAACHVAERWLRLDGRKASRLVDLAALSVAALVAPWLLALPDAAARRVAAASASPTVYSLRRAWALCDAPPLIAAARACERLRGLRLVHFAHFGGVKCAICAVGRAARRWLDLKAAWRRDPHHLDVPDSQDNDGFAVAFDVVLHVHGGAFIASFEAAHWRWFHELAGATDSALVVIPEYDLAPEHPYPTAVNQVHRVVDALLTHDLGLQSPESYGVSEDAFFECDPQKQTNTLRKKFKIIAEEMHYDVLHAPKARRAAVASLVCSAESAGACIMASVVTRLAKRIVETKDSKVKCLPDALLLAYPPLNLLECESPSRVVHAFDPFLPTNTLICCSKAYGSDDDATAPNFMSYYAPDDILRHFPPTLLLCGGSDPLLDDAVDFHTRLKRLGVDSHLLVHRRLTHGFLGMLGLGPLCPPHALDLARQAVRFLGRAATRCTRSPHVILQEGGDRDGKDPPHSREEDLPRS